MSINIHTNAYLGCLYVKNRKTLRCPLLFSLNSGHYGVTAQRSKKSVFLSALKYILVFFAVAFFVLSGNAHAQQTVTCPHTPSDPPTDRDSLIALYCATDGINWRFRANWLTDELLDTWYGVTTNSLDETVVEVLDLGNNNLSGTIPAELGNLTSLQNLHLYYNQLSGTIPAELGELPNLKYLYLYNNNLSRTIPAELGNLISLTHLSLENNQLSGTIPTELGELPNLVSIVLRSNNLSGSIPSELGELPNLTRLSLENNELSGSIPTELGKLLNLQHLHLKLNELSGSIPTELVKLTNLQRLYLNKIMS